MKKFLIVSYLIILHAALLWLLADRYLFPRTTLPAVDPDIVREPAAGTQTRPAVIPPDSTTPEPTEFPISPTGTPVLQNSSGASLIIPVQGVGPEKLQDTFADSRSGGRVHDAIDIMAPAGTPVLAAADGELVKFFDSQAGGITIYQISTDKKYFFYYAHLQRRAEDISESQFVTRGKVIGYVGDTGNAGPGNNHLHFAVSAVRDPKRFWDGQPLNPFPFLKGERPLD